MTFTQEQVERIVVEVIRRLGLLDTNPTRERGLVNGMGVGERSSTTAELRLSDKVISLRLLDGKLIGVTRLVIPQRAIITPAVKDELKSRKIELVRTSP
jgi:hypothetical protein